MNLDKLRIFQKTCNIYRKEKKIKIAWIDQKHIVYSGNRLLHNILSMGCHDLTMNSIWKKTCRGQREIHLKTLAVLKIVDCKTVEVRCKFTKKLELFQTLSRIMQSTKFVTLRK